MQIEKFLSKYAGAKKPLYNQMIYFHLFIFLAEWPLFILLRECSEFYLRCLQSASSTLSCVCTAEWMPRSASCRHIMELNKPSSPEFPSAQIGI